MIKIILPLNHLAQSFYIIHFCELFLFCERKFPFVFFFFLFAVCFLQSRSNILLNHLAPPRPVVLDAVAPHVEPMVDAFRVQNLREPQIVMQAYIPVARGENDFHLAHFFDVPIVAQILQVIKRRIEVGGVVVITVNMLMNIITAAQANELIDEIGMAKRQVRSVITAKAATGGDKIIVVVDGANQGNHFVENVRLVLRVAIQSVAGMSMVVVPTFFVNAVGAEYLIEAVLDLVRECADHSCIFILEKSPARGRKNQNRCAAVSENQQFHPAL